MQANVTNIEKREIAGELRIVTSVDFVTDAGELVHSQEYGHLPEEFDPDYFQRQADAMQKDLDHAAQVRKDAEEAARIHKPIDALVAGARRKLLFAEKVNPNDRKN
jgi:hypothetical protein